MADIKYLITVDEAGAVKSVKNFEGVLDGLEKKSDTAKKAHSGLWQSVALGQFAYDAARKAGRLLVDVVKDSIDAAMDAEKAESALSAALETTGRTRDGMLPGLLDYAKHIQKVTVYEDDEVKSALALMVQLTKLDEQGLKVAMNGAIGLASVMQMDLLSATRMVSQGYEGNYLGLGKLIPEIRNAKTETEKHAAMVDGLAKMYGRAEAETGTFSGSLKQLNNMWGEVKETVGGAIIGNEKVQKTIKDITAAVIELVESGKLEEWLTRAVTWLEKAVEWTGKFARAAVDANNAISGTFFFKKLEGDLPEKIKAAREEAVLFQGSLKVLKPSMDEIRRHMEEGPEAWAKWTAEMRNTDDTLVKNKGSIVAWVEKAVDFFSTTDKLPLPLKKTGEGVGNLGEKLKRTVEVIENKFIPSGQKMKWVLDALESTIEETAIPAARNLTEVFELIATDGMDPLPAVAEGATTAIGGRFDGLYNDIASGWGTTIQTWLEGATTFRDFMGGIFGNIKDAFFRMIGEMVADWTLNFLKSLVTDTAKAATTAAKSITDTLGKAVGGLADTAGKMAGGFLGALGSVGSIISGITGLLELLKGPQKATDVTYWLKLQWELQREMRDWMFINAQEKLDFYALKLNDMGLWILDIRGILTNIGIWTLGIKDDKLNAELVKLDWIGKNVSAIKTAAEKIAGSFKAPTKAALGFEGLVTSPRLFLAGESGPERVSITPVSGQSSAMGRGDSGRPITIPISVYLGGRLLKTEVIEIVESASVLGGLRLNPKCIVAG